MRTLVFLLACVLACLAPAADEPVFEVASVKASVKPQPGSRGWTTMRMDGGPGTGDPTRIDFQNVNMSSLITRAYDLDYWKLSAPDWIVTENYDVTAKVPAGATKEQFQKMLQNLLAERFKLQVHRETRQVDMYSLTVRNSKLKPHVETPAAGAEKSEPGPLKRDAEGYPILTHNTTMAWTNGKARLQGFDKDITWLAGQLSGQLGGPLSDDTGLRGHYDIELYWAARQGDDGSPDLPSALQQQLGLKLEKKKGPVEMLIVDRLERTPVGN
jgi:uncharacterized protein (TIGR03435 family)